MEKPYYDLNSYLRARFGERVDKICLDGGFTCPNRDGRVGRGGCLFCGERGAGEEILCPDAAVGEQMRRGILHAEESGRGVRRFIAYFQNFCGTYAKISDLRRIYDAALTDARTVGLAVATRPDCVDGAVADLLAEYAARGYFVWVELGLQTASDEVAAQMHIGYPRARFSEAVSLLASRGIEVVAHMMLGLPGEGLAESIHTAEFLNRHAVSGLKLHATYVLADSGLASLYTRGEYTPLTREEYIARVCEVLAHLRPDLVIHRLTGDPPRALLLAPDWCREKIEVLNCIHRYMREAGLRQGCRYSLPPQADTVQ